MFFNFRWHFFKWLYGLFLHLHQHEHMCYQSVLQQRFAQFSTNSFAALVLLPIICRQKWWKNIIATATKHLSRPFAPLLAPVRRHSSHFTAIYLVLHLPVSVKRAYINLFMWWTMFDSFLHPISVLNIELFYIRFNLLWAFWSHHCDSLLHPLIASSSS